MRLAVLCNKANEFQQVVYAEYSQCTSCLYSPLSRFLTSHPLRGSSNIKVFKTELEWIVWC